jgi:hypothetical protein
MEMTAKGENITTDGYACMDVLKRIILNIETKEIRKWETPLKEYTSR